MKNKEKTQEEKDKIVKEVVHSFKCEGMTLTDEEINNIYDLLDGKKTAEQLIKEVDEDLRKKGLIK